MKATESLVDEFEASLPFKLDPFQREAIEKLDSGRGCQRAEVLLVGEARVAAVHVHVDSAGQQPIA